MVEISHRHLNSKNTKKKKKEKWCMIQIYGKCKMSEENKNKYINQIWQK